MTFANVMGAISVSAPWHMPDAAIHGTTYYVSPTGNDANSGTSPSRAWQTVRKVNKVSTGLHAGDAVLFQGGATFGDDVLMPGWGAAINGTTSAPIVFGSYGRGQAAIPRGIWINGSTNLVFENFNLGPAQGMTGTGDNIVVQDCYIHDVMPGQAAAEEEAINAIGTNWTIRGNTINRTGDSGMLIRGDQFRIAGNLIQNTGLDPAVNYGAHGIYLKATNSIVTANVINGFNNDGVSVRYRDSIVTNNLIENGEIGLAWFQYDPSAGASRWAHNTIVGDTVAGIYISGWDPHGGDTRESFTIRYNRIAQPSPRHGGWEGMNLRPTSGTYSVYDNQVA